MSRRHFRRLYGGPTLPPLDSDDDIEYEPLYAKSAVAKFEGLELSSDSNKEEDAHITTEEESDTKPVIVKQIKKKLNKKKTKKNKSGANGLRNIKDSEELDEIERSVKEVNELLGSPAPAQEPVQPTVESREAALLTVQLKYLNYENELRRRFGPDEDEKIKKKIRTAFVKRLGRKSFIVPIPLSFLRMIKIGLSMSILRREKDYTYFAFDHSPEYQNYHKAQLRNMNDEIQIPQINEPSGHHVESILVTADQLFDEDEFPTAAQLVEHIVALMHYVAHTSFALASRQTRLEYKVLENRPYHIAMLKFAYIVSKRACHRTALEICKLLLNLDPTDPLAVQLCIDFFAIRAREYQWLHDTVKIWRITRDAGYLFNLRYSYALAKYHIVTTNKEDIKEADKELQEAILLFPTVVIKLLKCAPRTPSSRLMAHPLYTELGSDTTPSRLNSLISLYAKRMVQYWRVPNVLEWLMSNALAITDIYDKDLEVQAKARICSQRRMVLFPGWPAEIARHVSVIRPMSEMIDDEDGWMPLLSPTRSFDPLPPPGINRYKYMDWELQRDPRTYFSARQPVPEEQGREAAAAAPPQNAGLQEDANTNGHAAGAHAHVMHRPQEQPDPFMSPRSVRQIIEGFIQGLEWDLGYPQRPYYLDELAHEPGHDGRMDELAQEGTEPQQNIPTAPASEEDTSDDQQKPPPTPDRQPVPEEQGGEAAAAAPPQNAGLQEDANTNDHAAGAHAHVMQRPQEQPDPFMSPRSVRQIIEGFIQGLEWDLGYPQRAYYLDELAHEPGHDGRMNELAQEGTELQQNIPTAPASEEDTSDDQQKPPPTPE